MSQHAGHKAEKSEESKTSEKKSAAGAPADTQEKAAKKSAVAPDEVSKTKDTPAATKHQGMKGM